MSNIDKFLEALRSALPEICSDRDLCECLPYIFKNPATLNRMRGRGQAPAYFAVDPNIYYLRDDVVTWMRSRYQSEEIQADQCCGASV